MSDVDVPETEPRLLRGAALRPARAVIDLGAIRHNAATLAEMVAPAALCAVVKADAYGHGAVPCARAAVEGGATWVAVALVDEGIELRQGGIDVPILVLSEPPVAAMGAAVAHDLTPTIYTLSGIAAATNAAAKAAREVDVHVKVDTGMHRVGAALDVVTEIVAAVPLSGRLRIGGLWTHLAVADGTSAEDRAFTSHQLDAFDALVGSLRSEDFLPSGALMHAANSAATLVHPQARYDMVRCGIALYGSTPSAGLADAVGRNGAALRPALELRSTVTHVQRLPAGARPSYGRRYRLPADSLVATVPVGYADGVPRRYFDGGGTVLLGGRQRPLAGTVTMDQIVVDCGADESVGVGDEVVLIGRQGDAELSAAAWADVLGTISYEVLCGIGPRVPRTYIDA